MMEVASFLLEASPENTPKTKLKIYSSGMDVSALSIWSKRQANWIHEVSVSVSTLMMHALKTP